LHRKYFKYNCLSSRTKKCYKLHDLFIIAIAIADLFIIALSHNYKYIWWISNQSNNLFLINENSRMSLWIKWNFLSHLWKDKYPLPSLHLAISWHTISQLRRRQCNSAVGKREGSGNFFLHLISLGISGAEKVGGQDGGGGCRGGAKIFSLFILLSFGLKIYYSILLSNHSVYFNKTNYYFWVIGLISFS